MSGTQTAYAKLNLALHVRGRRGDGYHELETLFAFLDGGDAIAAGPAPGFALIETGEFAGAMGAVADNLVTRAALAAGGGTLPSLAITIQKRLPVAAGLGGGSADAAAVLRLLGGQDAAALAPALGADVPACLASRTCFGSGVGDQLTPIALPGLAGTPALLVNPRVACPTGPVFAGWDGIDRGPLDPAHWEAGRNDLEPAAIALIPEIAQVLAALRATAPRIARMSGSGATCFALYADAAQRDAAAARIAAAHPGWWQLAGALR